MKDSENTGNGQFQVEQINALDQFEKLRPDWEQVYQLDSKSQLFLSWLWLHGWFNTISLQWLIIAIKDTKNAKYVSFLPLIKLGAKKFGIQPIRRLTMGGQPFAAYTGFLCLPQYEDDVLPVLASHIQNNLKWDIFNCKWTRDQRLDSFLSFFPESQFSQKLTKTLPSLFINLPDSYEAYLQTYLGKSFRKTFNKRMRFVEQNEEYKVAFSDNITIESDIKSLILFWKNQWGERIDAKWYTDILHEYDKENLLWLITIKHNEIPISFLACILDPAKKTVLAYVTSYDPAYSNISPGIIVFGYAIKNAIEKGYNIFDFTVGLDRYKVQMGAKKQPTYNVNIERKAYRSSIPLASINMVKKVSRFPKRIFSKFFK